MHLDFSGNYCFFTISCHRQTYQNYQHSRQKLGTFLENKVCTFKKILKLSITKCPPKMILLNERIIENCDNV